MDDDRIDRLENRVDRLETSISADLRRIFEKLEILAIDTTKHACPAPGSCVGLSSKLQDAITAHNATMLRVERLELKILECERATMGEFHKLEKQKMWVMGAWSVISIISAIIGTLATIIISHYLK